MRSGITRAYTRGCFGRRLDPGGEVLGSRGILRKGVLSVGGIPRAWRRRRLSVGAMMETEASTPSAVSPVKR